MIKAIITDIEGTTSSLAFVKDTLFPYARDNIEQFIHAHENDILVRQALDEAANIIGEESPDINQIIRSLIQWIDDDKKITPLKTIQGLLWEQGYLNGHFNGHIYEDAVHNLKKWNDNDIRLYVFSSGSIHAQKLLFGNTEYGDLNPLFSGYFDTKIGSKTSVNSYQRISEEIAVKPKNCLFLSDIKQELEAAHQAGMHTIWLVRSGEIDPAAEYKQVTDFGDIYPEKIGEECHIN